MTWASRVATADVAGSVDRWLDDTAAGQVATILLIVLVALLARALWGRFVERTTNALTMSQLSRRLATTAVGSDDAALERYRARAHAVSRLLKSVGTFVIFVVAVLVLLARVGFNVAPLLASAGVAGLAIGFGAQAIIRDFLSGVFMITENQYGIGDTITVNAVTGTVEDVGLRITRLRDVEGTLWYVANGSVTVVGNHSQGWSVAVVDIPVPYGADLERVHEVLGGTAMSMQSDDEWSQRVLDDEVQVAAESMTALAVTFRIRMHTRAGQQLAVGRELRIRALSALEAAGVPTPSGTGASGSGSV